jgi:UDP:flavonoid glycosyltransferase YjiC (YdhE family)
MVGETDAQVRLSSFANRSLRMRVLFSSLPMAGHFGPLAPFVGSLLRLGHQVMVAAPGELAPAVAATGAEFWPVDDPSEELMGPAFAAMQGMSHDEANQWMAGEIFGRLRTAAAIPRLVEAVSAWRPEVMVRESAAFGAAVVGDLCGIPHVRVGIGLGRTEELLVRSATPAVDAIRRSQGLGPDADGRRLRDAPFLTLFPARLEDPLVPSPARTHRFRDPRWRRVADLRPGADLVYVTFGSVAGQLPGVSAVFAEAVRAVADLDVEVLLTVGRGTDPASFGPLPAHVRAERWVDQVDVLRNARAVVCHGGGGTVVGALAAGVPLVVVPLFAEDQHINAHRLAAVGAGVLAAPSDEAIRSALRTVLADDGYRRAARELASEIADQTSTDDPRLASVIGGT